MARPVKASKAKKVWVNILAPKTFNNVMIGESLVYDPTTLIGTVFRINLMTITNDMKNQNTNIMFRITSQRGNDLISESFGLEIIPASIKRFVRKEKDRLDLSFKTETKDKKPIRVKLIVVTRNNLTGSIKKQLRKLLEVFVKKEFAKESYEMVIENIVRHKIQKLIRSKFKKLSPLKMFDIRAIRIEGNTDSADAEQEGSQEQKKEEKKPKDKKKPAAKKEEKKEKPEEEDSDEQEPVEEE